jgi:hypothetical protein
MPDQPVNPTRDPTSHPSRRTVLRAAAAAAALGAIPRPLLATARDAPSSQPASQPAPATNPPPWWVGPDYPRSRVIEARSGFVLDGVTVSEPALAEILDMALRVLTETDSTSAAWQDILGPAERILVKFNQVGAVTLGTSAAMARVLVRSLHKARYSADKIALVEAPADLAKDLATRPAAAGWGSTIPVGKSADQLSAALIEADAVINVPFLKTHQIAGMSGALKNVAYGFLRHPARFHDNGCSPYVGHIIGHPEVASRIKIHVMDALRVVVRNGPDARPHDIAPYSGLLLARDPLALDIVAREHLVRLRRSLGFSDELKVRYLDTALGQGIGRHQPHMLDRKPLTIGDPTVRSDNG